MTSASFRTLLDSFPVVLAPMEDVTDAAYRAICRTLGAELCMTEFVRAERLVHRSKGAMRKAQLASTDRPTGIQIYGANPELLVEAAQVAAEAEPTFIDINCGCWQPRVAKKGAGAGWLRDPPAMLAMAERIVRAVPVQVTVKTRIGWGPESHMPIVDLARRLEDAGVAGLTIHCRTAQMGHTGPADWSWAGRAQQVVSIPVVVNGDIRSAADVDSALSQTGCSGAMIGRAAIDHPWIFREARSLMVHNRPLDGPSLTERIDLYAAIVEANARSRGPKWGIEVSRRHLGVLGPLRSRLRTPLCTAATLPQTLDVLNQARVSAATRLAGPSSGLGAQTSH